MGNNRIKGLVSIVVSNYNNGKYVKQCLNSLINQSYKNIEIIIVDDCSTDNSVKLIKAWINRRSSREKNRIKFLKMPQNIGFSGAVTVGMYLAQGEYIAMQDSDDVSHKNRIKLQVKYLEENQDIMMVGSNYYVFEDDINKARVEPNFVVYGKNEILEDFAQGRSPVCFGTILFKGSIVDEIGGLTRKLAGAEDYEFIQKSVINGIDNIEKALYFYRSHEGQRSRIYYPNCSAEKDKINKKELSVLLVLDKFNIGGTETHVLTLTKQLIKDGIKVTVVASDGPLAQEFEKLNCKIYNIDFPLSIEMDSTKRNNFLNEIYNIFELEKISVVHAHQSSSGNLVVEAAKKMNIKSVFTIHGMYYYDILGNTLKIADSVISVSIPVYRWLLKFGINSIVVPNGIAYKNYANNTSQLLRRKYNISRDTMCITYCSRMAWEKINVCKNLITVVRDLRINENIKYEAVIVGDGPGYKELKALGDEINKELKEEVIHFTGNQIDVNKYYVGSDCVLGTGRVAIEAMAASKKVIAGGNSGYFGLITSENFNEAWQTYFGDHDFKVKNDAIYLYNDMKKYYLDKRNYDKDIYEIYKKSKELFEIGKVIKKLIDIYTE